MFTAECIHQHSLPTGSLLHTLDTELLRLVDKYLTYQSPYLLVIKEPRQEDDASLPIECIGTHPGLFVNPCLGGLTHTKER